AVSPARLRSPARARLPSTTPAAPVPASTANITATSSRRSPTWWCTDSHDQTRPHQLREHGTGLLPARCGGRGGAGRADRPQPEAGRRRDRPGADLLDRVRAPCRHSAHPAAAVRLVRGGRRLDPARVARGGLGGAGPAPSRDGEARGRARRVAATGARGAGAAGLRGEPALRLSSRLSGALLREAPLPLRAARARRSLHLSGDGARGR